MAYKTSLLFFSIFFLFCIPAASQKTLKVYYHSNGYRGNLYYRVFNDRDKLIARKWFYVNKPVDSIVLPAEPGGGFELYSGWTSISFKYESGKAVLTPIEAAEVINTTDHSIEISFNTARVGIETSGLTYNYMLSAFAHIPSRDSADEAHRALHGNKTFTLIKGMYYGLNTQAYNAYPGNLFKKMLCNPTALCIDTISVIKTHSVLNTWAKNFPGIPNDIFLDAFTFTLDANGRVIVDSSGAAHAYKNRVILNTVKTYIDPACISGGNVILIVKDASTFYPITTPKSIKVMKGLLNHLGWTAGKVKHDYFYILLPGCRQHGKRS